MAFLGALGGVWLGRLLDRRNVREDERRRRLEDAYRAVAATIARKNWSARAELRTVEPLKNVASVMSDLSRDALKQYFTSLREAREKVALVTIDGVDVGDAWRTDEAMQAQLDDVLHILREALQSKRRPR